MSTAREGSKRRTILTLFGIGGAVALSKFLLNLQAPSADSDDEDLTVTRPKRSQDFPQRLVPRTAVPKPLPGGQDAVGGIESIVIAGKRYWFGFSYRADAVLSPLMSDPNVVAQFGSDYMLQTDGAHPPEYWQKLVQSAIELSELATDAADRNFTGFEVRDALRELEAARREQRPAKGLVLPDHLAYLFHAATQMVDEVGPFPCAGKWEQAYKQLDHYGNCRDGAVRVITGKAEPPAGTDYDDALEVLAQYIAYWRRNVPENWRALLLSE